MTAVAAPRTDHWSVKALGAVALVVVASLLTFLFTSRLNVTTAIEQQQTTAIQQFQESGAKMDASLSLLVDAILDGRGVADARKDARTAVTLHASQTYALNPLVGTGNTAVYVNNLGTLRALTDNANGRLSAKRMAQLHVNVMDYRMRLVAEAQKHVYQ